MDPNKKQKTWGINVEFKSLNWKFRIIFKYKRNDAKLINGWKVKKEENWESKNTWEKNKYANSLGPSYKHSSQQFFSGLDKKP
jgi:hypothetical protein